MEEFKQVKQKMKTYKPAIYDLGVCYLMAMGLSKTRKKRLSAF